MSDGYKTTLSIGIKEESLQSVSGITNIDLPDSENVLQSYLTYGSSGAAEYIPTGVKNHSDLSLDIVSKLANETLDLLRASFHSAVPLFCEIKLADKSKRKFIAYVQKIKDKTEAGKVMESTIILRPSGEIKEISPKSNSTLTASENTATNLNNKSK